MSAIDVPHHDDWSPCRLWDTVPLQCERTKLLDVGVADLLSVDNKTTTQPLEGRGVFWDT